MFEKIYIINLKDSTDKNDSMKKEMEKQNFTNYLFFEAIDGENENLDENYQFSVINHWRDPFTRRTITKGEIGCALTHYWIWEEIVNHQYSSILVLEDDVVLEDNFLEKLNNIDIPKNMDFLYLGRREPNTNEPEQEINKDIVIPSYSYGSHGYILTLEGAKKLLTYNFLQNLFTLDEFLPMIYDTKYPYTIMKSYFAEALKEPMNFYCLKNKLVKVESYQTYDSSTFSSSPYINLKNPIQNFIILSIATQQTDGYNRFIESCNTYGNPYKILGLNTEWKGDGYKLLLLYEELSTWSIEKLDNTIVLYTDCYDVIITSNYKDIINFYNSFNTKNVLFQANKQCIPTNLNEYYPETNSSYKYLNAGGFIGYGNKIFELLNYSLQQIVPTNLQELFKNIDNKWLINEHLYFTLLYLQKKIVLDTECKLFQPLFESAKDIGVSSNWCITNHIFKTTPLIIQGSKNEYRIILNQLSNYLINGWSPYYNYKLPKQIIEYPIIFIYCKNTFVNTLDYPTDKIILYHEENFVEQFLTTDAQYLFYCYNDIIIENKNTLTILLKTNKDIIAPMIVYENTSTNFWSNVDISNDTYGQTMDYIDIIQYERKFVFNVPHIQDIYLLHKQVLLDYPNLYENKSDISVCKFLRNNNKFMFVTNIEVFGKINDNISIYEYNFKWKDKFIHPKIFEEWNELGDDVFSFPLFTPEFCSQLIKICNDKNEWSPGKDCKNIDKRIGFVEPVPTQDTHLKQVNLHTIWSNIMEEYIKPLIFTKFKYTTMKERIAFVVRYMMTEQTRLKPHHDASTYTLNICLSDTFEGSGCHFIRQNKTVINKQIGYCLMHPGKLTHFHEALPITSGERYILVSFVD